MLDDAEVEWLRSTANELNNLLQVISESTRFIESHTLPSVEVRKYFNMLQATLDRAGRVTGAMLDRDAGSPPPTEVPDAPNEPASQPEGPSAGPAETEGVEIHNPTGERELIMIVDDEDFVRLLAQRVLTDEGYRVITAKDGFEALELYKKLRRQIALIILDFTMPIMEGSEVFTELQALDASVPVMLSSGFTEHQKLRWMLAKGLRGFIPKPYTQEKLLLQVRSTLDALQNERNG